MVEDNIWLCVIDLKPAMLLTNLETWSRILYRQGGGLFISQILTDCYFDKQIVLYLTQKCICIKQIDKLIPYQMTRRILVFVISLVV